MWSPTYLIFLDALWGPSQSDVWESHSTTKSLRERISNLLVDKILKKIAGWRGKLLSNAGRIVLTKTCLASVPAYLMSFFKPDVLLQVPQVGPGSN
jgi:hypothetical protein